MFVRVNDITVILLLIALGLVALGGWLAVGLGFVPPPGAATVIRIASGRISLKRGQLRAQAREDLADVLSSAGIACGFIAMTGESRVHFSRNIPPELHQRLRNVLLN